MFLSLNLRLVLFRRWIQIQIFWHILTKCKCKKSKLCIFYFLLNIEKCFTFSFSKKKSLLWHILWLYFTFNTKTLRSKPLTLMSYNWHKYILYMISANTNVSMNIYNSKLFFKRFSVNFLFFILVFRET